MRLRALILATSLVCNLCLADAADDQAKAFNSAYVAFCLKHLTNLEDLRTSLADMPRLSAEKADYFLQGKPGDAWPLPEEYGQLVIAVPEDNSMCLLYARRVEARKVEAGFKQLVTQPPAPLVSKLLKDERATTGTRPHTLSYEWSKKGEPLGMLFTLTTTNVDNAPLQALASAALVKN